MAVKIKLMRLGKIRQPYYRIVVADSRTRRNGKAIETIGKYHPKDEPSLIEIDADRAAYWLGVGAQPTQPVERLLKLTGDWQRHQGEPVPESALKVREPKPDKAELFAAALAAAGEEPVAEATTPKKKSAKKSADDKADKPAEATEAKAADEKAGEKADDKAEQAEKAKDSE